MNPYDLIPPVETAPDVLFILLYNQAFQPSAHIQRVS